MKIIITKDQLAYLLEARTKKKSLKKNKEVDVELDEQDAGDAGGASGGAAATPTDTSSPTASVSKGSVSYTHLTLPTIYSV